MSGKMPAYNGGCLCGNIRYMYNAEPAAKVSSSSYFILFTACLLEVANLSAINHRSSVTAAIAAKLVAATTVSTLLSLKRYSKSRVVPQKSSAKLLILVTVSVATSVAIAAV